MMKLSVNVDHIATLRNARGGKHPDPFLFAQEALASGASGITVHLREDRRHIKEQDVRSIAQLDRNTLNLEMALTQEMTDIALDIAPDSCCLVPEKRQELTTESGVDPETLSSSLLQKLASKGIKIFLFIDPTMENVSLVKKKEGIYGIELHTGDLCHTFMAQKTSLLKKHLSSIEACAQRAHKEGLCVHAGHGLSLETLPLLRTVPYLEEVSIGHELIAHALMVGMKSAVQQFCSLLSP